MQRLIRSQRGAYLVIVSLLLVVLIGFGALALDLGRLFILRSEMQNAADAAALAAARELGREAGAQGRAILAARDEIAKLIKKHLGVGGETVDGLIAQREDRDDVELLSDIETDGSEETTDEFDQLI